MRRARERTDRRQRTGEGAFNFSRNDKTSKLAWKPICMCQFKMPGRAKVRSARMLVRWCAHVGASMIMCVCGKRRGNIPMFAVTCAYVWAQRRHAQPPKSNQQRCSPARDGAMSRVSYGRLLGWNAKAISGASFVSGGGMSVFLDLPAARALIWKCNLHTAKHIASRTHTHTHSLTVYNNYTLPYAGIPFGTHNAIISHSSIPLSTNMAMAIWIEDAVERSKLDVLSPNSILSPRCAMLCGAENTKLQLGMWIINTIWS